MHDNLFLHKCIPFFPWWFFDGPFHGRRDNPFVCWINWNGSRILEAVMAAPITAADLAAVMPEYLHDDIVGMPLEFLVDYYGLPDELLPPTPPPLLPSAPPAAEPRGIRTPAKVLF